MPFLRSDTHMNDSEECELDLLENHVTLAALPESEKFAFLQLSLVDGVGTRIMARLIHRFVAPSTVLASTL